MSNIEINSNLHNEFTQKVIQFVDNNKDNIKNFFQSNGTISKANDNSSLLEDKPILYLRNPTENNNFYLEIYNIAAAFRFENSFFQMINHLNTIFGIFNNKYKDQPIDTKKRQLASLFEGIEEQDSQRIDEIIGFNFEEDFLYDIKLGLDKLVKYFGLQNIQMYYESKVDYKQVGKGIVVSSLSGIAIGAAVGIFSGSVCIGTGIGLGIGIIVGILSLLIIKWNKPASQNGIDKNKVENNIKKIEDFFHTIKYFYTSNAYKNANVIIVAIDKSNENYNDFIMYGQNLKYLNGIDNPKRETPGTNREYYDTCFELTKKYINKYENMFTNKNPNLENEIKNDFKVLKGKMALSELKNLLNELISKEKEPLKNQGESISNSLKNNETIGGISESTTSISTLNYTETEKHIKKKQPISTL